jgi:hypothetical protein
MAETIWPPTFEHKEYCGAGAHLFFSKAHRAAWRDVANERATEI